MSDITKATMTRVAPELSQASQELQAPKETMDALYVLAKAVYGNKELKNVSFSMQNGKLCANKKGFFSRMFTRAYYGKSSKKTAAKDFLSHTLPQKLEKLNKFIEGEQNLPADKVFRRSFFILTEHLTHFSKKALRVIQLNNSLDLSSSTNALNNIREHSEVKSARSIRKQEEQPNKKVKGINKYLASVETVFDRMESDIGNAALGGPRRAWTNYSGMFSGR